MLPMSENNCHSSPISRSMPKVSSSRPQPAAVLREPDLVWATRAQFDARGMQEAPIEDIARSAGIARGLVYRTFSSKERAASLSEPLDFDSFMLLEVEG